MDKIELSFRMVNRKKLLGSDVLGQFVLSAQGHSPPDSLEHYTLKLNEGGFAGG